MGSATSINVPTWQVDLEGHTSHRYGNDKTRAELKSRLLQHDYSALIIEAGEVNKSMKEAFFSVIGSRGAVDETDTEVSMSKRRAAIELIVGHLTRLRNPKILNFFVVVLSALALGYGVPVAFWSLLTFMGLLFSRRWTIDLVREIGDEVASSRTEGASETIGLCVTDNKAYFVTTAHVHAPEVEGVTEGPRQANGKYLYTVNNLQVPLQVQMGDVEIGFGKLHNILNFVNFQKLLFVIRRSVESGRGVLCCPCDHDRFIQHHGVP